MSTTADSGDEFEESDPELVKTRESSLESFEELDDLVETYNNVIVASEGSELYNRELYWDNLTELSFDAVPKMEAYSKELDMVENINSLGESTLLIGLDLENDIAYVHERNSDEYSFEGNWWDNVADLEIDVLLDRSSYEGAVSIPRSVDIERFEPQDYGQDMYMITQSNP